MSHDPATEAPSAGAAAPALWPWPLSRGSLFERWATAAPDGDGPFRVLVVSTALLSAPPLVVGPVLARLFIEWPTRAMLASAKHGRLATVLRPLGLAGGRAHRLVRLARAYPPWAAPRGPAIGARRVSDLPGCGPSGGWAWRLFVEGDLSTRPSDRALGEWWEWACAEPAMVAAAAVAPVAFAPRKRRRKAAAKAGAP